MTFLSIETTADGCSISWIEQETGHSLVADEPRSHARRLAPLIRELLDAVGSVPDAIALSAGPGSYTGLRIGASTAKGLCWSLDLPLYAISTFDTLVSHYSDQADVMNQNDIKVLLPARKGEVFSAGFDIKDGRIARTEEAIGIKLNEIILDESTHYLVPTESLRDALPQEGNPTLSVVPLHSENLVSLLRNQSEEYRVEDVSSFEPHYLREFVAKRPAKSIFERLPF